MSEPKPEPEHEPFVEETMSRDRLDALLRRNAIRVARGEPVEEVREVVLLKPSRFARRPPEELSRRDVAFRLLALMSIAIGLAASFATYESKTVGDPVTAAFITAASVVFALFINKWADWKLRRDALLQAQDDRHNQRIKNAWKLSLLQNGASTTGVNLETLRSNIPDEQAQGAEEAIVELLSSGQLEIDGEGLLRKPRRRLGPGSTGSTESED